MAFQRPQPRQFCGVRIIFCRVVGILEVTVHPLIRPEIQRLVHPVKIKSQSDGFAHLAVGELRAMDIECQPAGILRCLIFHISFNDKVFAEITALILRRPIFRRGFHAEIKRAGLKRLQRHIVVEVIVVADGVKIIAAPVDGQIGRPVIRHAGIGDVLTEFVIADAVRPAARRRCTQRFIEFMLFPECLRQNRQTEQAEHHVFIRFRQHHAYCQARNGFYFHTFIHHAKLRYAFGHEFSEAEGHITGGNRGIVVETGARIDIHFDPTVLAVITGRIGDQRIITANLIAGGGKQAVVKRAAARSRITARREAVEVVVSTNGRQCDLTAFRGGRIDVVKTGEV
ncbi:hypothetical protein SRABI106_02930 [Rahnella aquatilis]|nr:hypothetical protein SRABI106_02930 [Rahnella aquatilis]